jgi:hypothetical protein
MGSSSYSNAGKKTSSEFSKKNDDIKGIMFGVEEEKSSK